MREMWNHFRNFTLVMHGDTVSQTEVFLSPNPVLFQLQYMLKITLLFYFVKILFIYFYREGKGRRKRGRETSMCGCLSCAPYWGPGTQPRHVPWLGIEPVTLWFAGWHSVHWATPARAKVILLIYLLVTN